MKLLAIDTSGLVASAALLSDGELQAEYMTNFKKTHSQTLLPMIAQLQEMLQLDLTSLDAIALAEGPGSFTGLRIGAATAKGLGLALEKPLIGVPTVDALAYNLTGCAGLICPLMNARRNQTYTGIYRFSGTQMITERAQCCIPLGEILTDLNARGETVMFLGDGVPEFRPQIEEGCTVPFAFAPPHLSRQRAGAVAALAAIAYVRGDLVSADDFAPVYLRLSQAERERLEKEAAQAAADAARMTP